MPDRTKLRAEAKKQERSEDEFAQEITHFEGSNVGVSLANCDSQVGGINVLRYLLNLLAPATISDGTIALPSVNRTRPATHMTVDIEYLLEDDRNTPSAWLERFVSRPL